MYRMSRFLTLGVLAVGLLGIAPATGSAQVVQSLNLSAGLFMPRGEESRIKNDVWLADVPIFRFDIKDFTGGGHIAHTQHRDRCGRGRFLDRL